MVKIKILYLVALFSVSASTQDSRAKKVEIVKELSSQNYKIVGKNLIKNKNIGLNVSPNGQLNRLQGIQNKVGVATNNIRLSSNNKGSVDLKCCHRVCRPCCNHHHHHHCDFHDRCLHLRIDCLRRTLHNVRRALDVRYNPCLDRQAHILHRQIEILR
ncbi:hypothetical protein AX774_g6295, partial [Zancudomyces culisetae]